MDDFLKKMQVLLRTETAIFRINLQTAGKQIVLFAVGIVLILLALAALNVGIYTALADRYGGVAGALIVAVINGILAVILMVVANRTKPGPEAAMAKEIRDLAISEISTDVDKIRQNLDDFKSDVERIKNGFNSLTGGGGGGALFGLSNLAPLIELLISSLKKSKK